MTRSFLGSKLRPAPPGPDYLERPRLFERLDRGLACPITLVAAPAGYGKSTLLSEWTARLDLPWAWLSLEENDNDASLFLEEVTTALDKACPGSCADTRALLSRPVLPSLETLIRAFAQDLDELPESVLILDDCQNLKNAEIQQILQRVVLSPPGTIHLVLSCRADPMLPLGGLRGRGLLNEVRAVDLRFRVAEAAEYLPRVIARPLTESQIESLTERTEGWATGLRLAALSLAEREDLDRGVRELTGTDRHIADYLMEELLTRIDPAIKTYLTTTSILERLSAPLCQALLEEEPLASYEGRPVLEWLDHANLFIIRLDDRREWFRYHHLFRDLLRRSLSANRSEDEVIALHIRAGTWLGEHGYVDDALDHFLGVGRSDLACDIVERHRREAMDDERWRELQRWLARLGADAIDARPGLVSIHAWLAHQRVDTADKERYCDRAEQLLAEQPPRGEDGDSLRGELAALRAQTAYQRADGERTLMLARQALRLLPPSHRLARATATVFEGAGLHLLGHNDDAFDVFRRGSFGEYGQSIHPRLMIGLGVLSLSTGKLEDAEHVGDLMLTEGHRRGLDETMGWGHLFLGMAAYFRNRLLFAADQLGSVSPLSAHANAIVQSAYFLARTRLAQGQADLAVEVLDQLALTAAGLGIPLGPEFGLLRARLAAPNPRSVGDLGPARSLLPREGRGPVFLNNCYESAAVTACALLVAHGPSQDLPACAPAIDRLLAGAETSGNVVRIVQCLTLQALLLDREERRTEALTILSKAVEAARPARLVRLFPDLGDRVLPLLRVLGARSGRDTFIAEVIAAFRTPDTTTEVLSPSVRPAAERDPSAELLLTNRELDVLELLAQRMTNKEIARRLVISPATVKRHTLNIYGKLGVKGRREAVLKARQWGLIADPR